jgi:hypothetical protein
MKAVARAGKNPSPGSGDGVILQFPPVGASA